MLHAFLILALDQDGLLRLKLHLTDSRFRGCSCPANRMVAVPDGWFGPCELKVYFSGTERVSVAGLCEHGDRSLDEGKGN